MIAMVDAAEHDILTGDLTETFLNVPTYSDDKMVTGDFTETLSNVDDKVVTGIFDEESSFSITKAINDDRRLSSNICSSSFSIRVPDVISARGTFLNYTFLCDNVSCGNDKGNFPGNSNVTSYACTLLNTGNTSHSITASIAMNGPIISGIIQGPEASYEIETHIERSDDNSILKLYYGYAAAKSEDTDGQHAGISAPTEDDHQLPSPASHSDRSLLQRTRSFRGQKNFVVSNDMGKNSGQRVRKIYHISLYEIALNFPFDQVIT